MQNVGMATGNLDPGRTALPHYHKVSEEVYFVLSGTGRVTVGSEIFEIGPCDAVFVPINVVHSLENTNETNPLVVLCISSPPFAKSDFYLAE